MLSALGSNVDRSALLLGVVLGVFFFWRYTYGLVRYSYAIAVRTKKERPMSRQGQWIAMIASFLFALALVSVAVYTAKPPSDLIPDPTP
jgi:ABC-type Mn2+/Zn2+ transport system permease subunit